jgi:hypothetical protein
VSVVIRWLHHPAPPDRRRRVELFCDTYGIPVPDDMVARVTEQQRLVLETCRRLARRGVEPQATRVRKGYLDVLGARITWAESIRL